MNGKIFSRLFRVFMVGAGFGVLLTTWLAPKVISWYFDPPVQFGINCKAPIDWSLDRMRMAQFVGVILGGILAWVIFYGVLRRKADPEMLEP